MARIAWHFLRSDWRTVFGNLPVQIGKPIVHDGPLIPYISGLHASMRAIDALFYARGPVITLVQCEGRIVGHSDILVCNKRTALWGYDATDELWAFARAAALEVLHLWPDAPKIVRKFLETGNEDLRTSARDAAWVAARSAAGDSARDAARDAAKDAVRDATSLEAGDVAWVAARDVAINAALATLWNAAGAMQLPAVCSRFNKILESILLNGAISRGLMRAWSLGRHK